MISISISISISIIDMATTTTTTTTTIIAIITIFLLVLLLLSLLLLLFKDRAVQALQAGHARVRGVLRGAAITIAIIIVIIYIYIYIATTSISISSITIITIIMTITITSIVNKLAIIISIIFISIIFIVIIIIVIIIVIIIAAAENPQPSSLFKYLPGADSPLGHSNLGAKQKTRKRTSKMFFFRLLGTCTFFFAAGLLRVQINSPYKCDNFLSGPPFRIPPLGDGDGLDVVVANPCLL